jgi:DNA primase
VFPIYDADASPTGFVGRRPDDRGVRWLKQQTREIALTTKSWLYGIDKAGRYIRKYRTIILVEGIFDYFAFYNLLQDQDKTVVVSTLGSYLTPEAASILKGLDVEHFIVAYNWDAAGRNGIERIAAKSGGWVYYLGSLAEGQDPYDMLKPVVNAINGFSLKHLKTDAQCASRR